MKILEGRGLLEPPDRPARASSPGRTRTSSARRWRRPASSSREIEAIEFILNYEDVDDWWVAQTQMSTRTGDADRRMDYATRSDVLAELERASEPFLQPDGAP